MEEERRAQASLFLVIWIIYFIYFIYFEWMVKKEGKYGSINKNIRNDACWG